MENYKLGTNAGNNFFSVSKKAKEIAESKNLTVEFEFNGVKCLVENSTNLDRLYRDYCNAHTMDWKEVTGHYESYPASIQNELDNRIKAQEQKQELQRAELKKKDDAERFAFEEKVKGIQIELSNESDWLLGKENNKDDYGACIYEYAEGWAKLMQSEAKEKGFTNIDVVVLSGIAQKTSHEMGFLGITGFMYGAAVSILSQCWKHGEELRKWHNKEYNHQGDGVVNPAVLTIK